MTHICAIGRERVNVPFLLRLFYGATVLNISHGMENYSEKYSGPVNYRSNFAVFNTCGERFFEVMLDDRATNNREQ